MERIYTLLTNTFLHYALLAACVFFAAAALVPTNVLIIALNGIFIGTMFAISIAYGELMWDAIWGNKRKYDDVRQMVAAIFIGWAAYGISVASSVYLKAIDASGQALILTAAGRYLAVIAAVMQITAPNLGEPFFYGRDRKLLWAGVAVGLIVAVVLMLVQATNALALGDYLGVPTT